jgi:hypothetical protein
MSNHYNAYQTGISECNSSLRWHKNKTIKEVLNDCKLLKIRENGRVTVYTCKKIKYTSRVM